MQMSSSSPHLLSVFTPGTQRTEQKGSRSQSPTFHLGKSRLGKGKVLAQSSALPSPHYPTTFMALKEKWHV